MGKLSVAFFILLVFVIATVSTATQKKWPEIEMHTSELPTGAILPSLKKLKNWKATGKCIEHIRLNVLALERINQFRKQKGLPGLPIRKLKKNIRGQQAGGDSLSDKEKTFTASSPLDETAYLAEQIPIGDLPSAVDNSKLNAFPPIGYQSGGSCACWASTYYTGTHMTALVRGWNAKSGGSYYRLSPRWTYNLINGGENGGSCVSTGFVLMLSHGAARWSEFYSGVNPVHTAWPSNPDIWSKAINCRIEEYGYQWEISTHEGLENLKAMLNNGYVVPFCTYVNSWVWTRVKNDPATSEDDPFVSQKACYYVKDTKKGGHGMTCVGYNDTLWIDVNNNGNIDSGEKGALKIANSWGTGYWNSGFGWLAYDALQETSAVSGGPAARERAFWGDMIYWMTAKSSYTPAIVGRFTLKSAYRGDVLADFLRAAAGDLPPFSSPETSWRGFVLSENMWIKIGALGFDGRSYTGNPSSAPACTFVFDMTEVAHSNQRRYVLKLADKNEWDAGANGPVTVQFFSILDGESGSTLGTCMDVPQAAEGNIVYPWIDISLAPVTPSPSPTTIVSTPTKTRTPKVPTATKTRTSACTCTRTSSPSRTSTPEILPPTLTGTPTSEVETATPTLTGTPTSEMETATPMLTCTPTSEVETATPTITATLTILEPILTCPPLPMSSTITPVIYLGGKKEYAVFPNPSQGRVCFRFDIKKPAGVDIRIFAISGKMVSRIKENLDRNPAVVEWNTLDISPGMYVYQIYLDGKLVKSGKIYLKK